LIARVIVQYLVLEVVSRVRTAVPGWRAEWEAELTFRLGSELPTGAPLKRAIEEVAAHISVAQQLEGTSRPMGTDPQRKVQAALEIIQRRHHEPGFRLRTLATRVLLTPSHLDRLLTRHTGHSFIHHLRNVRLETAQRILSSTALSIKQVAARAGYNSVTHLDRDFRKHIGCSPSQWRRQNLR
jgi:two-component system response regulator YesN